jgi:beta-glucosidase
MNHATDAQTPVYLDPALPRGRRVDDLLGRMTLEEKCGQMLYDSPAIPRLGIPEYNWGNECLHGVARAGGATVFPQAIGLGATFDPDLIKQLASAIADEARAKHHETARRGNRGIHRGLTFWTPNINLFRDPRWGRGQETYGEDPYLTARIGVAFVKGLQGDHPEYLKAAACAKHFAVHSGPEKDRHSFDALAGPKDMNETYLPAFKALVDAGVEAVMGAYNRVNGEPACASSTLLEDTLRRRWGFGGHVVSDCGAIRDIHENHKLTASLTEAVAMAVKAGCDLNCGCAYNELLMAFEEGLLAEQDIDRCVRRLLETRFKLGMFDPPQRVPFTAIPMSVVNCERHRDLALQAAAKSIVLLKNRHGVLPLSRDIKRILVVGPNASSLDVLMGNYNGISPNMTSILEGICDRADEVTSIAYRMSCRLDQENSSPSDVICHEVRQAQVVVAVMGLAPILEGEEGDTIASPTAGDRETLGLPANQVGFLKKITGLGTPVVLVLTGGSAIAIPQVHELVDAVLMAWYPGEQGGNAVADVLFGHTSPSGRLPVTVPMSHEQLPPFDDYAMTGRTYRYMTDQPLYPFGFGLSYTRFEYSGLEIPAGPHPLGRPIPLRVTVRNTGTVESQEVVQVYLKTPPGDAPSPRYSLVGMQRVRLDPGAGRELTLSLQPQVLQAVQADGTANQRRGTYSLWVGGCTPDPRALELGATPPAHTSFEVTD